MKRLLGAIVLVVVLGGIAEAHPVRRPPPHATVRLAQVRVIRPVRPLHPGTKPNFIGWLVDKVVVPVVKDAIRAKIAGAVVAAL